MRRSLRSVRLQVRYFLADAVEFFLQSKFFEAGERQASSRLILRSKTMKASWNALEICSGVPVTAAGSGTPQWAVIGWPGHTGQTSLAAASHGEHEMKRRGTGCGEVIPRLAAKSFGGQARKF